jgi:hypothetical protein
LVDKRRHSSIPDVRFFSEADCDNDHDVALAKYRERLAVSKRNVKKMDEKKLNLKTLNEREVKEEYQITINNRFAALDMVKDHCTEGGAAILIPLRHK